MEDGIYGHMFKICRFSTSARGVEMTSWVAEEFSESLKMT